ncbi:MAG: hypothetical protein HC875_36660 [Anaerolineales bacterium]|nr:hypothetical protein [Anaerolineales bacterium]
MSRRSDKNAHLLVEGKNDQHVVWALCNAFQLPETFDVLVPGSGGVEAVLQDIPARIDEARLQSLGIMLDADEDIEGCWTAVRGCLEGIGYTTPKQPDIAGFITTLSERPRIGVWVMPDNQLPGRLEDFVGFLIPQDDRLKPIAEKTLQSIEKKNLNRFRPIHRSKALIHTWLAWQETPGMPMGQAITARVLLHDQTLANSFIAWLKRLFIE